jgi:hypothetical protein
LDTRDAATDRLGRNFWIKDLSVVETPATSLLTLNQLKVPFLPRSPFPAKLADFSLHCPGWEHPGNNSDDASKACCMDSSTLPASSTVPQAPAHDEFHQALRRRKHHAPEPRPFLCGPTHSGGKRVSKIMESTQHHTRCLCSRV